MFYLLNNKSVPASHLFMASHPEDAAQAVGTSSVVWKVIHSIVFWGWARRTSLSKPCSSWSKAMIANSRGSREVGDRPTQRQFSWNEKLAPIL